MQKLVLNKCVARARVLHRIGGVRTKARFRVERKHCRITLLLHPTSPRQRLGLGHAQCAVMLWRDSRR